jgi:hypothetical protein
MTSVFKCLNLHGADRKYQVTIAQFHVSFMQRISSSKNSEYNQFSRHNLNTSITNVLVTVNAEHAIAGTFMVPATHFTSIPSTP